MMTRKSETGKRFKMNVVIIIGGLLSLLILIVVWVFMKNGGSHEAVVHEDGRITILKMQLPKNSSNSDMVGLIVYNGEVYTETTTEIGAEDAKALLGEKLGRTKGNIDEWSKQDAYDQQLASTISETDVYTVNGYDASFRIMTFGEHDGLPFAAFYENLYGITIKNGKDIFDKMKMVGNVNSAQYRLFSDWDEEIQNFYQIDDLEIVNRFVEALNDMWPFLRTEIDDPIGDVKNTNENFRELIVNLQDGSMVKLMLLEDGYVYYGGTAVYFEMEQEVFSEMWGQMNG